jgi:hypothetical protein
LFLQGNFPQARDKAIAYLNTLDFSFVSPVEAAAHFYLTASNYLSSDGASFKLSPKAYRWPMDYRKKLAELVDLRLEGTFSPTAITTWIESPYFITKVPDQMKRAAIDQTKKCLLDRAQCK